MSHTFANLMPFPRVLEERAGSVPFPGHIQLIPEGLSTEQADDFAQLAQMVLGAWMAPAAADALRVTVILDAGHAPDIPAGVSASLLNEAYEMVVGVGVTESEPLEPEIILAAAHYSGLQRGIQTLKQLVEDSALGGDTAPSTLPACRIVDWPRLAQRGMHYDFAREMEYRHEHVKSMVARIAYFKMNTFHLYLENLFAFPSAPEMAPTGAMTPEHVRDLSEYARILGVTLIPQISTLGHTEKMLHGPYEELREFPASPGNLCPTHPKSRPFIAGLIKDVAETFGSPFIHLGYDESHSGVCPRCQQHGTPQDILADYLNWMNAEVKKYGARSMIYADKFLAAADFPMADATNGGTPEEARRALERVSRDIILTDWHYTAPYGRTVDYLVEQGFEVQIATDTGQYSHDSIPLTRGYHWVAEITDEAIAGGATGAFNCNWELLRGTYFENYWAFNGLAAERHWTDRPHDYVTFGARFSARFWGLAHDYYTEMASLIETTPINRRMTFLDSSVLAGASLDQARFVYLGIADYLDSQLEKFRAEARRNADTLQMLDMPALIIRYVGTRVVNQVLARYALDAGDRQKAREAFEGIRAMAQRVADKFEEGHRIYGAAVGDRERIGVHLAEIEEIIKLGDIREWVTIQSFEGSALQPRVADINEAELPGADLPYKVLPVQPQSDAADIREIHLGKDGLIYLRATVQMPHDFSGKLLYGSDGPIKVWVNEEVVGCTPDATNPCVPDEYVAPVNWQKGENCIVLAIGTNGGRAWGACARTAAE